MAEQNIGSFLGYRCLFKQLHHWDHWDHPANPIRALAWQRSNSRSPGSHPSAGTSTCHRLGSLQPVAVMTWVLLLSSRIRAGKSH